MEPIEDSQAGSTWYATAFGLTMGAFGVLFLHGIAWMFLALGESSDTGPTRTCPCPRDTTAWTFVFWLPEAFLAGAGVVAVLLPRRKTFALAVGILAAF